MDSQRAECRENWEVVKRNSEHAKAKAGSSGQIRDEKGEVAREPLDDELIPPAPEESLEEHSFFPNLDSNRNKEKDGSQDGTCTNPNTPKRVGATLEAPGSQRQKLDEDADIEHEAREFSIRHCISPPETDAVVNVTAEDIAQAGKLPGRGFPEYSILLPEGRPTDFLRNPSFLTGIFRSLGPKRGWVHEESLEPLTTALRAAGARCVELYGFRTLGAGFEMERPPVDRSFTAWALPPRLAQSGDWHDWRLGVRLGDNAAGTWAPQATSSASTPAGVRKAAVREVMEALRAKGKVGYPTSVTTGAQLGYPVMAYQSAAILSDSSNLVRLEGACTGTHPEGKAELTRRAKAGYSPCCTGPTHIAVPTRYSAWGFSKAKGRGVSLWTEHGQWAARRYAVCV